MLPQEIIRTKRDGGALSAQQIDEFVAGITSGAVADAQAAAVAIAVYWRGMDVAECGAGNELTAGPDDAPSGMTPQPG